MDQRLLLHRNIWESKPVLRQIYNDYYRRIISACADGPSLELGGGPGNIKESIPGVISADILSAPWLDFVADAQKLPVTGDSFRNIILFDVLHHIENPVFFFREASRILKPGGRIIMLEPAITPLSWFFYHFMHQEPVRLDTQPLAAAAIDSNRDPFESNQAIPTLLFGKFFAEFQVQFPEFSLLCRDYLSLFAYPLSGGFKKWSLIPEKLVAPLLRFESSISPWLGEVMGFRLFIVLEKNAAAGVS